ncbi:MAG TPA: PilN domain-containing protein [Gemmatimonadales bacterium]|nr:PilN domain-containing protein [Gemmatimonadales bacterium]
MVRSRVLGLAVEAAVVRAALVEGRRLTWAGSAPYAGLRDLAEVIARLAGEAGRPVKRVRVALARDVVQLRTVHPAPRLKARDVPKYVALDAGRLFRKNGVPLVSSGALIPISKTDRALWAAATSEPLVKAILDGCAQAGIIVEAVAPSAETLPAAIDLPAGTREVAIPYGGGTERLSLGTGGVWRSRWSRDLEPFTGTWIESLSPVNGDALAVAAAYAAAVRVPTMTLLPETHRASGRRRGKRRLGTVAAIGFALWLLAAGIYVARLSLTYARTTAVIEALRGAADTALNLRRDLDAGRATLATIGRARAGRSHSLRLLGDLTHALPDSVTLIALEVLADGTVRMTGYAPRAAVVLAGVGRVPEIAGATLEGPVTRELVSGVGERERFTVVAREGQP